MPRSLEIMLCVFMAVALVMFCLLFYFKFEEPCNRLTARLWRGFLTIKSGLTAMAHRLAGANWRTTFTALGTVLFGILTVLSILPDQLGPIAEIIPTHWKVTLIKISLASTALLHFLNGMVQKDRAVTGGSVIQDIAGKVAAIQPPVPNAPAPALPNPPASAAAPPAA